MLDADARREARKSLLAFASDDAKAHVSDSELVEEDIQDVTNLQTDSDNHSSRSTPVSLLYSLLIDNVVFLV